MSRTLLQNRFSNRGNVCSRASLLGRYWDRALTKTPTEMIGLCLYPSVVDLILARPSKNGVQSSTRTQPLLVRPLTVRISAGFARVRKNRYRGDQNSDLVSTGAEGSRQSG